MLEKLKSYLADDTIFQALLLIVVAVGAFGLGRQSAVWGGDEKKLENNPQIEVIAPIKTVTAEATSSQSAAVPAVPQAVGAITVVGSKSGAKYHLPNCSGAKRIKPENLITFDSVDAAKAAGYTAAANCPGLQ